MSVVGIEMVKRDRESFGWWWPAHLKEMYDLCDALYIRADPETYDQIQDVHAAAVGPFREARIAGVMTQQYTQYGRFQEDAERQELLRWAFEQGAEWAVCFDADEVLEPGGGKALRALLQHPNAQTYRLVRVTLSYCSHHRPGYIIPRGLIQPYRAFRLDKHSQRYLYKSDRDGLHCGSVPAPGVGSITVPDLRVIHYHATSCEEYMDERRFYDNTVEVDRHGGIDFLYRCGRFGEESEAVTLEQELSGAEERLARVANAEGLIR